jgi:transcriptional regulator with XRE-family HTH domain
MIKYERVENVSKRIQEAMYKAEKTQADLARETGISGATISRYLSGQFDPKQNAINKMAVALNVAEMWLWGCDVPMERPAPEEVGSFAADVLLNPDMLRLVQIYSELEEADKNMLLMLAENMHNKTKKD